MMIQAHISSEIWGTMMSVTTEHTDTNKIVVQMAMQTTVRLKA